MKNIFLIIILLFTINSFAQEDDLDFISIKDVKKNSIQKLAFKLSLLTPSLAVEIPLADKFSLDIASNIELFVKPLVTSRRPTVSVFPQLNFILEPKWNYNIKKRFKKGKNVNYFSSNFLSFQVKYNMRTNNNLLNFLTVGPTWGIQRNFAKYGYFKINTGLGYTFFFDSNLLNQPAILINLRLGFIF